VPTGLAVVNSIFMAVSIVYGTAVYAKYRHWSLWGADRVHTNNSLVYVYILAF
jgi:hypothetical protein